MDSSSSSGPEGSSPIQELSTTLEASTAATSVQQRRCLVISLIRHAQCVSNATKAWNEDDDPDPLTEVGRFQAESLGKEWANTRIDYLMSSPLERAHDTAKALSDHNETHPEVHTLSLLVERQYGRRVPQLMRYNQRAGREELTGRSAYSFGVVLEGAVLRGEIVIRSVLQTRGVISEPPEFFTNKKTTTTPAVLPDGIPHVVIVSHNVFLSELYEKLHYWGGDYKETKCDYRNAGWSRHILWYDENSDELDVFDMKFCAERWGQ
ncbi:hypothetical protein BS47DRAFT_1345919 [Hydnum rufescens UP504]|uniref:Phosphoglycerate mutase-like protein n=1 Tax=Hydnum rufescens UP504 TaxID=1448309 RepID=A0A9P6AUB9_9AGAM|nr:hypothetical protein BS47DRAFT_1345919 [Hydnum rufescens UP504]